MRVDCGPLDPDAVIRPIRSEWHPRLPECLQPVPSRLARNSIIESTFEVGRRFRCTKYVTFRGGCGGAFRILAPGQAQGADSVTQWTPASAKNHT